MKPFSLYFISLVLFALGCFNVQASPDEIRSYGLTQQAQGKKTKVTIYERRSHRAIWSGLFPQCESVTWSPNRRAVIFEADYHRKPALLGSAYIYRIIVWCPGFGLHVFDLHATEYSLPWTNGKDFLWSPDTQAVLWRTGDSGAVTEDEATLFCIDLAARRNYEIGNNVRIAHWLNSNVVKYQRYFPRWMQPVPKEAYRPHLWHRPSKGAAQQDSVAQCAAPTAESVACGHRG